MSKAQKISPLDITDYLDSKDAILEYLNIVITENNPDAFLQALTTAVRANNKINTKKP